MEVVRRASQNSYFSRTDVQSSTSLVSSARGERSACLVFIAPTQHGKSTTIDKFYESMTDTKPSQHLKEHGFVLGNGTVSATKNTMMLPPVEVRYLSYLEWPAEEEEQRELSRKKTSTYEKYHQATNKANLHPDLADELYGLRHDDMLGGTSHYEAKVRRGLRAVVNWTGQEENLSLRILDTPGLDDSNDCDDRIMEGLLDSLTSEDAPELCAFVFVIKRSVAFGHSFLSSAKRYWDQFPGFRDHWIFIHTCFDAYAEDYENASCFEEACERRKKDLIEALTNEFNETPGKLVGLPHIFLENIGIMENKHRATGYKKKAEFQKMERAKAFNRLTTICCSNPLKQINSLEYRKSPENEVLDGTMLQLFEQRKQGLESALSPLKKSSGKIAAHLTDLSHGRQDLQFWIKDTKETLRKIDTDDKVVKAAQIAAEEWTFWGGRSGEYELEVAYFKTGVTPAVTKNYGYPKGECIQKEFEWDKEKKVTRLKVACSSGWCRGYEFDLKLLVDSKVVHRHKIEELKMDLAIKEAELARVEADYQTVRADNSSIADAVEVFQNQIEFFKECEHLTNKKTVELGIWKKLSKFYYWAQSREGQEMFHNAGHANTIIEQFCEVHGMRESWGNIVKAQQEVDEAA